MSNANWRAWTNDLSEIGLFFYKVNSKHHHIFRCGRENCPHIYTDSGPHMIEKRDPNWIKVAKAVSITCRTWADKNVKEEVAPTTKLRKAPPTSKQKRADAFHQQAHEETGEDENERDSGDVGVM